MDCTIINRKWVYKVKQGPPEGILKYKVCWIIRGFQQKENIDYVKTFALVVKPMSYKAIFALAAANNGEVYQIDVKTIFLY